MNMNMIRCQSLYYNDDSETLDSRKVQILSVRCNGLAECHKYVDEKDCQPGDDWFSQFLDNFKTGSPW